MIYDVKKAQFSHFLINRIPPPLYKHFFMWTQLSRAQIQARVNEALKQNIDYRNTSIIGLPGTYLNEKEFPEIPELLEKAAYLKTFVANPNHIGCHTLSDNQTESYFAGTQELEKEVIELLATDILRADPYSIDGYIASGGTEANIQAIWIYRNYYQQKFEAKTSEIALFHSTDSHYSMHKAANLLGIKEYAIEVSKDTRSISLEDTAEKIESAKQAGIKYFILVCNAGTTMFGSMDDIDSLVDLFSKEEVKIHIDAAFGGFITPLIWEDCPFTFANPNINSITMDGHKMLQTPYGTGVFLIRKGWMDCVVNNEASYVMGKDHTLSGSRSGANAVAMWMTLMNYGKEGWIEHLEVLMHRKKKLTNEFDKLGMIYYAHPYSNIITLRADTINPLLAEEFGLIPDNHDAPNWYKIVVMAHVTEYVLDSFFLALMESKKV